MSERLEAYMQANEEQARMSCNSTSRNSWRILLTRRIGMIDMDFTDRLDEICLTAHKVSYAMLVLSSAAKHAYTAAHALARTENASNGRKIFAKVDYVADRINDICEIAQRLAQTGEELRKLLIE